MRNQDNIVKQENESYSVVSDSWRPHGLYSPWNSPGQNTGVDRHSLPQGIFPTKRANPGLPHCRQILYQLSHQGSPILPQLKINLKRQKNKNPTNKLPTKSQTSPGLESCCSKEDSRKAGLMWGADGEGVLWPSPQHPRPPACLPRFCGGNHPVTADTDSKPAGRKCLVNPSVIRGLAFKIFIVPITSSPASQ